MLDTIICGDCLEIMPQIPDKSVDAIITDPPFTFIGGSSNGRNSISDNQFFLYWWRALWKELNRILKPNGEGFVWCDWRTAPSIAEGLNLMKAGFGRATLWRPAQMIYHYREMGGMGKPFRNSVDTILYVRGPKSDGHRIHNKTHNMISEHYYYGSHKYHPTEKSVSICERLISWCSDEGDTILDPFVGSGTTAVACKLNNRHYICIEKEQEYCDIANKRLKEML